MNKSTQYRRLLSSDRLEFLMEAHDGLSAHIVEEAGFKGIWASGLCISASLGVRDNNEASWTQVLDVVEFMSDASSIPIMLDADTGYGNFNNVRRLVRKLEQRHVAAMCIEDKLFPKTNSFIGGEQQPLADVDEFCGKIRAAKETQQDPDFTVVARVEAFIAGWGLNEALRRAEAYHEAGADAILIHSKLSTADEVLAFMREWGRRSPIVLVPTTYSSTPTSAFEEAGASIVIWANHLLRASITAMQQTTARIHKQRSIFPLESEIAPVKEVFRLQNAAELKEAERRYLPQGTQTAKAILLQFPSPTGHNGHNGENGNGQNETDKNTDPIRRNRLQQQVADLNTAGVKRIVVSSSAPLSATGLPGVRFVAGSNKSRHGEVACLAQVAEHLDGPCLLTLGDVLVETHVLRRLTHDPGDIVLVVDAAFGTAEPAVRFDHLVRCTVPASRNYSAQQPAVLEFAPEQPHGEWIGVAWLSAEGARLVREGIAELRKQPRFQELTLAELFTELIAQGHTVDAMYVSGAWQHAGSHSTLSEAAHA